MYGFAVAGGEAAEVLEFIEAALDLVALLVEFAVIWALLLAVAFGWDHGDGAHVLGLRHDGVRVVAFVGDHGLGLVALQQILSRRVLAGLACGDAEVQRQTVFVGQQVNLAAQTSSGTPQSRVFGAPFLRPVAACWCARTIVESIIRY